MAYHLLHSATRGFRYDSVMVNAAAGGIGSAIVQLARAAGKQVIALAGSDEKARFARSQGATVAINYREAGLDEFIIDQPTPEQFPILEQVAADIIPKLRAE